MRKKFVGLAPMLCSMRLASPPSLAAIVDPNNLDRLRQLEDIVNTSVQEVERLYEVGRPALVISKGGKRSG